MPFRFFKYAYVKRRRKYRYVAIKPPYSHCKNCGHELTGMYCSVCGQYAVVANQPFKDSIVSYFENNYSFDHKLGTTILMLFTRPGKLTREFVNGRINRYVHPFKLYFFSSILLFGVVLNITSGKGDGSSNKPIYDSTLNESSAKRIKLLSDSLALHQKELSKKEVVALKNEIEDLKDSQDINITDSDDDLGLNQRIKRTLANNTQEELLQKLFHYLSLSVLVLMPIFGLLLMAFYWRRERYYTAHLIHSVHIHIMLFLIISIATLWDYYLHKVLSLGGWLFLGWLVYLVLSLSNFYGQSKRKSLLKAFIILFFYSIILLLAVVAVGILTVLY